jgi:hypothetical protein
MTNYHMLPQAQCTFIYFILANINKMLYNRIIWIKTHENCKKFAKILVFFARVCV